MAARYRVWIVRCEGEPPTGWRDLPVGAVAVEPAERASMTARHARLYVEAFNRIAQARRNNIRAVARPVRIRYEGDPQPGQPMA